MMMEDKQTRRALIEKYLNAETTPQEEQQLRDWFARHEADEDERDFALLVGLGAPCASCLPELDDTDAEFEHLVAAGEKRADARRARTLRWGIGIASAAAVLALVLLLRPHTETEQPISPIVIAESIQQIMRLGSDEIESVVATPYGSKAILTAHMKDGSSYSYILTYDADEGTTSLLAYQNPSN